MRGPKCAQVVKCISSRGWAALGGLLSLARKFVFVTIEIAVSEKGSALVDGLLPVDVLYFTVRHICIEAVSGG